jgi:hypothetical protein
MTDLFTNELRSRGHWDVAILPSPFKEDRYLYETLEPVLARAVVRMRGWPLPFIDTREPIEHGPDWIGQSVDASGLGHVEAWRFFMSGQFNQIRGVSADWRTEEMATRTPDGAASVIEVWEILYYITEVFELAARFTMGGPPADRITVSIGLSDLANRALVVGQPGRRSEFFEAYRASIDAFSEDRTLTSEELLGDASGIAVDVAREFLMRFGWRPASEQLEEMQRELTERR